MTEYAHLHRLIIAFVLASARLGPAMAILPATSTSMITGTARNAATLAFAALTVPSVMAFLPAGGLPLPLLGLLALKEVVVGTIIGFAASIPFWVAENVGNFIDNQRGATMGEVFSPLSGTQVSTIGILFTQIVSTLFFVGGGILLFLGAVYHSYDIVPLMTEGLSIAGDAPAYMLGRLDSMMAVSFMIASPVIILMFLATVGLGFVNRTAPQLNVFFLSMPVKSALGIAMLVIYLQYILDILVYRDEGAILMPLKRLFG